jgi:hypothetical protein
VPLQAVEDHEVGRHRYARPENPDERTRHANAPNPR